MISDSVSSCSYEGDFITMLSDISILNATAVQQLNSLTDVSKTTMETT